jgi:hypothetical protein
MQLAWRTIRAVPMAVCVTAALPARAQRVAGGPQVVLADSKLWIEGGSNVRNWSCTATTFEGRVDTDSVAETSADPREQWGVGAIQHVTVRVVIRKLKCGNAHMEADLYRTLRADDPATRGDIVASLTAIPGTPTRAPTIETTGVVVMGGVTKAVHVTIATECLGDGSIKATGSVPVLMTDFGVQPPTGLFGLIRSHNEVMVKFALSVRPPPPSRQTPLHP